MKTRKIRILEILYGFILIVFGLNGFFAFLPIPEKQGFALEFLNTLHHAGYILPTVATIMTVSGSLLLSNRWTNLALIIQLPVSFNIFVFHLLHDWQGLPAAAVLYFINIFLIVRRFKQYKILFNQGDEHALKSR